MLLFISVSIFLSSLGENLEFIVHNEETLLTICFVAFIFFVYSFLGPGIFEDFQKAASAMEDRLFTVISGRFNSALLLFNELLLMKSVPKKFSIIFTLLSYRIRSDWAVFALQSPSEGISAVYLSRLWSIRNTENQTFKIAQDYFIRSIVGLLLSPVLLVENSKWMLAIFIKPLKFVTSKLFFLKVQNLRSLSL